MMGRKNTWLLNVCRLKGNRQESVEHSFRRGTSRLLLEVKRSLELVSAGIVPYRKTVFSSVER
jgi:hypothetical protein